MTTSPSDDAIAEDTGRRKPPTTAAVAAGIVAIVPPIFNVPLFQPEVRRYFVAANTNIEPRR